MKEDIANGALPPDDSDNNVPRIRLVRLGQGGTSTFRPAYDDTVRFIAVTECFGSVGVFFRINEDQFFCAHIEVVLQEDLGPVMDANEYREVRDAVKAKLLRHAEDEGWESGMVLNDTIVVVSTIADAAEAVKEGICAFLIEDDTDFPPANVDAHGFVVDQRTDGPRSVALLKHIMITPGVYQREKVELPVSKSNFLTDGAWRYCCGGNWEDNWEWTKRSSD